MSWLDKINWNKENLVPVIVQEIDTNQVLIQKFLIQVIKRKVILRQNGLTVDEFEEGVRFEIVQEKLL